MPTTYAHWRFGDIGLKSLDKDAQTIILKYRNIFDYGVHGPDVYFYYKAITHNDVNKFGYTLHWSTYREILKIMKEGYKKTEDKERVLSYILGFTAHFALDSCCHTYINQKEEFSQNTDRPASHGRIESQFDKYLMIKDNENPIKYKITKSLRPSKEDAKVISILHNTFDEKVTYQTLKDQVTFLKLLKDTSDFKRWFISLILDIAKQPKYKDLMITKKEYPEIYDSNLRLDKLFNKALNIYPSLVKSVYEYIFEDKELPPYFDNHFEHKSNYKEVPILSLEEEEKYIVE